MKKNRFKRGLASILTLGMLVGGINFSAYLPVSAEEDADVEITGEIPEEAQADEAVQAVREQIEALPDIETVRAQSQEERAESYNQVQEAYVAYGLLTDEQREQVGTELSEVLASLMGCFNEPTVVSETGEDGETGTVVSVAGDAPEDEEEEMYQQLVSAGLCMYADFGSSRLKGYQKILYEELKKKIAETAEGNVEKAEFTIKVTCTKEELEQIINKESSPADVLSYLLMDCPSEFYWYDKASDSLTGGSFLTQCLYPSVYGDLVEVTFICQFVVAKDYSPDNGDILAIDTDKIKASKRAVANAQKIVDAYVEESDYVKLRSYKEVICKLVNYDHAAAANGSANGMGPWQLVAVFDGNSETNVVCEGYSKAFQYLCDLSTFSNAVCYTVTGTMNGGAHMWNIVRIGEKSYMADITNSDPDSDSEGKVAVGSNGELFLGGTVGDISNGYIFKIGNTQVKYVYDDDQINLFGKEILTLSETPYDATAEPEPTPEKQEQSNFVFEDKEVKKTVGDPDFTITAIGAADGSNVTYKSSDEKVATVDENTGEVHIKGVGTAQIQATACETDTHKEKIIEYTLVVEKKDSGGDDTETTLKEQSRFKFEVREVTKNTGDSDFIITATGAAEGSTVTYESSNKEIATVDVKTGKVQIKGAGTVKIKATATATGYQDKTVEYTLSVLKVQEGFNLDKAALETLGELKVTAGKNSISMRVTKGVSDFEIPVTGQVKGSKVTFTSSNVNVATVDANTGKVKIVGAGNATITVTASAIGEYDTESIVINLTVNAGPGGDTSKPVNPDPVTPVVPGGSGGAGPIDELRPQTDFRFNIGSSKIVRAVGAEDFTITASGQVKDSKVTYSSSNRAVATVDANTGKVHIVGGGTTKIIATASATSLHKESTCEYTLEVLGPASTENQGNGNLGSSGNNTPVVNNTPNGNNGSSSNNSTGTNHGSTQNNGSAQNSGTTASQSTTNQGTAGTAQNTNTFSPQVSAGTQAAVNTQFQNAGYTAPQIMDLAPLPEANSLIDSTAVAGNAVNHLAGTVVTKAELEEAKAQNGYIVLDEGYYRWTIDGKEITADELKDIDLGVAIRDIPTVAPEIVSKVAGGNPVRQLTLNYHGMFGFTGTLTLNVGNQYSGKYGNLFYCTDNGKAEFISSVPVASNGDVNLRFEHASEYLVVMSDVPMSGENIPAEIRSSGNGTVRGQTQTRLAGNADLSQTKSVKTGDYDTVLPWIMCSLLAMIVLMYLSKRKEA